jgi:hypothetical protein
VQPSLNLADVAIDDALHAFASVITHDDDVTAASVPQRRVQIALNAFSALR